MDGLRKIIKQLTLRIGFFPQNASSEIFICCFVYSLCYWKSNFGSSEIQRRKFSKCFKGRREREKETEKDLEQKLN